MFSGPLKDELKKADPKLLYPAIRVGSTNPDGMARATLEHFFENQLTEEDVIALAPAFSPPSKPQPGGHHVRQRDPHGRLQGADQISFQGRHRGGRRLAKTQGGHGSENRTGEIMKMIIGYGAAAKPQIPALKELIASFNAQVKRGEYPAGELNNRRVGAVEEAIKAIEAAKDHPTLRSTKSASKR